MNWLVSLLAGPLVDVAKQWIAKEADEAELEAKIRSALLDALSRMTAAQAQVLVAELSGESWLQRNWRPIVALTSFAILVWYSFAVPILVNWFGAPPLQAGTTVQDWMYPIVLTCIGGYIAGRSFEKAAARWGGKGRS